MPVVASWDGANRRIYLAQGVTSFHPITDIYREYRTYRRTVEDFRKWERFMEAVGNEPKGGGKATPRFLRLLQGVKIVPFDEASTIDVTGEILTDDQSDPFDYSGQTTPTIVRYSPADAEIVYVTIPNPLQDRLDYAGSVTIDSINGTAGTTYPTGTAAQPVSNLADALTIAANEGLYVLEVLGNLTIDADISGLKILPVTAGGLLTFAPGNVASGCYISHMFLAGAINAPQPFFGETVGMMEGLTGVHGTFDTVVINGAITFGGDVSIFNASSGVPGAGTASISANNIDGIQIDFRKYAGGITLKDFTGVSSNISIDIIPGRLVIDSTVTGGTVKVRGLGEPIVNNGTPTVLDDDGFNPAIEYLQSDILTAAVEARLARKLIDADEVLSEAGSSNWQLVDADDGVTVLRTRTVRDKSNNVIQIPDGAPARRTKV